MHIERWVCVLAIGWVHTHSKISTRNWNWQLTAHNKRQKQLKYTTFSIDKPFDLFNNYLFTCGIYIRLMFTAEWIKHQHTQIQTQHTFYLAIHLMNFGIMTLQVLTIWWIRFEFGSNFWWFFFLFWMDLTNSTNYWLNINLLRKYSKFGTFSTIYHPCFFGFCVAKPCDE